MVTIEDFSRLVSGIYTAAVTRQHWAAAIDDIRRTMDGRHGSLATGGETERFIVAATLPPEAGKRYIEYYHRLDYVLAAVERGPVGAVRTGSEVMDHEKHREFYADWLRAYDTDDALLVRLTAGPRPTCFLVATLGGTESFYTPDRMKLMSGLVPHLQQALRTHEKLAALADTAVELAGALEVVRHGVLTVADGHVVINLNSAAERVVRAEDGLCLRSGRLVAENARTEQALHCAIQHALAGDSSTIRTGRSLTCVRPSGKRPYVIHVLPSHRRDADEPLSHPTALIMIIDPEDEPQPPAALLQRLYNLTTTEADVALRMMHGADPKQISDELAVSLPTVRTHLQHVFDKTDTHRQAELVRLLLVLSPVTPLL
ncbi:MAG: helix-turn-helix transcriptional regulator [Mycobacterium sp.]